MSETPSPYSKKGGELGVVLTRYTDNGFTASRYARRRPPAFERMMKDAEAGLLDTIIVYHFDRLTRRLDDLQRVIAVAEKGVAVYITSLPGLSCTTPMGSAHREDPDHDRREVPRSCSVEAERE